MIPDSLRAAANAAKTASEAAPAIEAAVRAALTPVGLLAGHANIREALADETVSSYLHMLAFSEILPSRPEFWQGDEAKAALASQADAVFAQLPSDKTLANDLPNATAEFGASLLPVIQAAWKAGRFADASVFAFAALAHLENTSETTVALKRDEDGDLEFESVTDYLRARIDQAAYFKATESAQADRLAIEAAAAYLTLDAEGITDALGWTVS